MTPLHFIAALLGVLCVLAYVGLVFIVRLLMRTTELTAAVSGLSTATAALATTGAQVVDALNNKTPSTPDADIDPLITVIQSETARIASVESALRGALGGTT